MLFYYISIAAMVGKDMNQQQKDFDMVIVGGGVIGGVLALQLAEQGYRVGLIEAAQSNLAKTNPERVVALTHGSKEYLADLGLWHDIAQAGAGHIRHIEVREPGHQGLLQMTAAEASVDALGYVVEIADVIRPIEKALAGKVEYFCPARLQAFDADDTGVRLALMHAGEIKHISAHVLLGADGTHSQVRRMAGIETYGWDHNRFGLVASVRCTREHADTAYECFQKSGPLAFLPLSDGRFSIVWALPPQEAMRMLDMPERMFLKRLQRAADEAVLPRSGHMEMVGKRACFPLELRVAKFYSAKRVALLGNAAHTIHPVAGQGMNLGLRDVKDFIAVMNSDLAKQDAGNDLLLKAYAEKRRLDVWAVSVFTESMLASFAPDFAPLQWARNQGLSAMQMFEPLRQPLLQHAAGLTALEK